MNHTKQTAVVHFSSQQSHHVGFKAKLRLWGVERTGLGALPQRGLATETRSPFSWLSAELAKFALKQFLVVKFSHYVWLQLKTLNENLRRGAPALSESGPENEAACFPHLLS